MPVCTQKQISISLIAGNVTQQPGTVRQRPLPLPIAVSFRRSLSHPAKSTGVFSWDNIVSLAFQNTSPSIAVLLYQRGSFIFPGLVVSERSGNCTCAKGACYDLILLHTPSSHWSNASSSFIITIFYRREAEPGIPAIVTSGEMCLQGAMCCGDP